MSEEKLYIVKNDEGKYLYFNNSGFWGPDISDCLTTPSKKQAGLLAFANDGHVVTLVEEPEKVVLTKEQAKVIEETHGSYLPATRIANNTRSDEEEELMMKAYVNGYTVKKKYLVYKVLVDKQKHEYFAQAYQSTVNPGTVSWFLNSKVQSGSLAQFTEAEIEHYGLQDCERVEINTEDSNGN